MSSEYIYVVTKYVKNMNRRDGFVAQATLPEALLETRLHARFDAQNRPVRLKHELKRLLKDY